MTAIFSPEQIPQLKEPAPIVRERVDLWEEVKINGLMVATIEPRPHYCDRGRWILKCYLPGLDGSDAFPRYYMSHDAAISETEAFLRWRLWKIAPEGK